jgi:hypothetical protein
MMRSLRICVFALTAAFLAGAGFAQDITRGAITGVVRDPTGAVIPGAKVTLSGPLGTRATTSGSAGEYTFPNLVPESGYVVTVEQPGFVTQKSAPITVRINQTSTANFQLAVAGKAQEIEVTEHATTDVDLASTAIGANLSEKLYQNVPINRNVSGIMAMAPGVTEGGGTGSANPSISGASGLENQYFINGSNVTDPGYGAFGTYNLTFGSLGSGLTFDFIKEVQVQTGGFDAQYGEALGGVVNVLTKSGTNTYHGDAFYYFRPHRWMAAFPNANTIRTTQTTRVYSFESRDFGGDVGGYLLKDRLFWYAGFNPVFNRNYRSVPSVFANSALGNVVVKNHSWNYSAKVNWNITTNHQLEGSVFGDPSLAPMGFQRFTSLASDNNLRTSELDFGSRTWNGLWNGIFSPWWVVNANFSEYKNHFTETPQFNGYQIQDNTQVQQGTGGQLIYNGLGFVQNTDTTSHQFTIANTFVRNAFGSHTLQLGYQLSDDNYNVSRFYTGSNFTIPNLPEFGQAAGQTQFGAILIREHLNGNPANPIVLRVTRGDYSNPNTQTNTRYHSGYVQDSWVINSRLTLKPGLRFEYQRMEGGASGYTFSPNWAPRVGVLFDPTGHRTTKIFANWGRFFEKIPLDIAVRSFSFESSVRGALYRDQQGPIDLSPSNYIGGGKIGFSGGPDAQTIVAGGTKAQYQDEVVGGVESQLNNATTVGARFIYRDLRRILEDVSGVNVTQYLAGVPQQYVVANPSASLDIFQNAFPCSGTSPGCDPATGFTAISNPLGSDNIPDGFPNPSRIYKALELTFSRRFSANWQFYGSYRLSKLFGNYEGLFRNDNGQSDPNITSLFDFTNTDGRLAEQFQPGVLPTDRRHEIKMFTNYAFGGSSNGFMHRLNGLNLGVSWVIQSGTPISQFLAHPAYDNAGEIPLGGRGSLGRTDWTYPIDAHADYSIKLTEKLALRLVADMFNVFNQKKALYVDQWLELSGGVPNPDFLLPAANIYSNPWQTPRYTRIAARLEF